MTFTVYTYQVLLKTEKNMNDLKRFYYQNQGFKK